MEENQEQLNKLTINGQEYDPTEAQDLIELGRKTREAESKFNVTFDSIMPAYTKANERAKQADQYEQELSEAKKQLAEYSAKKEQGTETKEDLTEAKEAARKLGIPFKEDLEGYIKRDDLDKYLEERDRRAEAIRQVNAEADKLAGEIDGSDGRPKFNKKAVLAYAQAYKMGSLQEAYNDMHADALEDWQKRQIESQRKPGLKTLAENRGNKEPKKVEQTKANQKDLLEEALFGSRE